MENDAALVGMGCEAGVPTCMGLAEVMRQENEVRSVRESAQEGN